MALVASGEVGVQTAVMGPLKQLLLLQMDSNRQMDTPLPTNAFEGHKVVALNRCMFRRGSYYSKH